MHPPGFLGGCSWQLFADLREPEALQYKAFRRRRPEQLRHQPGAHRLEVAHGRQHEHRHSAQLIGEMPQYQQRSLVSPVHVVEHHDQAVVPGHFLHDLDYVLEQPEAILGPLAREGPVRVDPQGPKDLPPRPVRRGAFRLDTPSPRDSRPCRQGDPGELLGQPGLPDSRLAAAEDQPSGAVARGIQPAAQQLQLAFPPDDPFDPDPCKRTHASSITRRSSNGKEDRWCPIGQRKGIFRHFRPCGPGFTMRSGKVVRRLTWVTWASRDVGGHRRESGPAE